MATDLPTSTSPAPHRNPFRLSQAEPTLTYSIDGRKELINNTRYRTFRDIFVRHAVEADYIDDESVIKVLRLSELSEEELSDLWEQALKATTTSVILSDTRPGYLNKDEFFVLLSELQSKLGMSDKDFAATFHVINVASLTRRNPFAKDTSVADPPLLLMVPPTTTSELAEGSGKDKSPSKALADSVEGGFTNASDTNMEVQVPPIPANGYLEYKTVFGTPVLATASLVSISDSSLSSPPVSSTKTENTNKEIIQPTQEKDPAEQNHASIETVLPKRRKPVPSSMGTKSGEIEVVSRPSILQHTHSQHKSDILQSQLEVVSDLGSPASVPLHHIKSQSDSLVEAEAPVSTAASDELALRRLAALRASEPQLPPRPDQKRSFSRRVLSKVKLSNSTRDPGPAEPTKAVPRYSLRLLTQVLHEVVTEGNIQLVESLLNLGANINYSSLDPPRHHHLLEVAALAGHTPIVDYFVYMRVDKASINHALVSAFEDGRLEMATRLVPHADRTSLQLDTTSSKVCIIRISLFGQIARNTKTPLKSRERLLEAMIDQKQFLASGTVYEIHDKKLIDGTSVVRKDEKTLLLSYNALQLLISNLYVELVAKILPRLLNGIRDSTFRWAIPAEQWHQNPQRALEMLQVLISNSTLVDNAVRSEGRPPMTPLAHSVAGGCLDAVALLLEHGAEPECMIYELLPEMKSSKEACTALGSAAKDGKIDLCRVLVDAGAIPWRTDSLNRAPLYWASRNGHLEVVEYLLSLDTKRCSIDSCLIVAIEQNEPQIATMLMKNGATVNNHTWEIAMGCQPKPRERTQHLEIIDLLLPSSWRVISGAAIACAIDTNNFAGLSKALEYYDSKMNSGEAQWQTPTYISGDRKGKSPAYQKTLESKGGPLTCIEYAEHKGALDFVSLLKNYSWLERQPGIKSS